MDHQGRVCLVMGGSSGIGAGAARALAAQGAAVAVHGLDEGDADGVVREIIDGGGAAIASAGPIQDAATSEVAVEKALAAFGRLDTLVVSSGIQRYGDVVETSAAVWDEVFAVNVTGAFLASKAALPALRASGAGAIVFVASVQGSANQQRVAAYAASKGALIALVRAMAVDEAQHGVRVNSVSPGSIDTPMLRASAEGFSDETTDAAALLRSWGTAHPIPRLGRTSEVGDAIAYLAGPRAAFITGVDLRVDGGMLSRLPAPIDPPARKDS